MKDVRQLSRRLGGISRPAEAPAEAPVEAPEIWAGRLPRPRGQPPETRLPANGSTAPAPPGFFSQHRVPAPPGRPRVAGRLFFDIEATGLGNSPVFLVGVMRELGGDLVVRQFLARDYSEEAAVIRGFLEEATAARELVSYNGKSYDLPYLRNRAVATAVPFALDLPHRDLLHEARRKWKEVLPDCRLQTIERRILGRGRADDIPGHAIPDAYHAFVRTGDPRDIVRILEHNRIDLLSLAAILRRLDGPP
jgi:hypothetical protein